MRLDGSGENITSTGVDVLGSDTDGDGVWDSVETRYGTDPNNVSNVPDTGEPLPICKENKPSWFVVTLWTST